MPYGIIHFLISDLENEHIPACVMWSQKEGSSLVIVRTSRYILEREFINLLLQSSKYFLLQV